MYKIYFGENLITFPPSLPQEGYTVVTDSTPERIRALIEDCYGKGSAKIALFSSTGQDLAKIFDGFFRSIEAAGGVVRHWDTGKILMIRRWGRWDLPKGWKEPGETSQENALREVSEETGIARLEIEGYIDTSHHAYILDGNGHSSIRIGMPCPPGNCPPSRRPKKGSKRPDGWMPKRLRKP